MADHILEISKAAAHLDRHPDLVRWHYINAALAASQGNVSATARRLGMHRRTLQRVLAAKPKGYQP